MKRILFLLLNIILISQVSNSQTIKNFNENGGQLTRFDKLGNALDAHDGEIALFNGVYYLYGTSYDCGFEWGNKTAPFCGFKTYSSTDLSTWTDEGFMFDATTNVWQTRCNGKTYGCFRPHVIYNEKTKLYVLWINVYDNQVGYRVFVSKTPVGPFEEVKEPKLAVNSEMPVAGLNNGDHDLFIDDDGTAYLAYTDWRTKGTIVIEKLDDTYLTGTGIHIKNVTNGNTEAPALFKHKGIYYVTYSDPNCGYCSSTGTSYKTAPTPLGPWSDGIKISDNSCGGQPSFVSTFKFASETIFLYGSDLWNNAAKNEALANFYWAPLTFSDNGAINPLVCRPTEKLSSITDKRQGKNEKIDKNQDSFITSCDISKSIQRAQFFTASKSGVLSKITFASFQSGHPNAGLTFELYEASETNQPLGNAMYSVTIPSASISWSPKNVVFEPLVSVKKRKKYVIVIKSSTELGCYGFEYNDFAQNQKSTTAISTDNGVTFKEEKNKTLKYQVFIK